MTLASIAPSQALAWRLSRQLLDPVGGVVAGTWAIGDDELAFDWFAETGRQPSDAIERQVGRLAGILDRPLRVAVRAA